MSAPTSRSRRSPITRPYRRLRRWARHTPNGTIAVNLMAAGLMLIFLAAVLGYAL